MAEAANRRIRFDHPSASAPSTTDIKAAIRETRQRLDDHVTLMTEHVDAVFTTPGAIGTEAPVGGAVAAVINTIAVAGRTRRTWTDAKRNGLLRPAAFSAVAMLIGVALVAWTRRR